MKDQIKNLIADLDLDNSHNIYLYQEEGEFFLDHTDGERGGYGVCLECLEGSISIDSAVDYLVECF